MIVKFLYTKGANGHFPAVQYNTSKLDRNKGELIKAVNFGPSQGLGKLKPQDYKNHFKLVSSTNKAVKKPQFHVAISCAGKEYDKHQLTEIAVQWLDLMGYSQQPYLVIFHNDTDNNHVHIVSTRVNEQGKKIKDSFEQIRGLQHMQTVMGLDPIHNAVVDTDMALSYCFQTKAQFLMILESMGYSHKEENGRLRLFKFGKQQGDLDTGRIHERLGSQASKARQQQITAWFHKYARQYDTSLTKLHGSYQSEFSVWLKQKMGIELIFHASGDKPPYGYTVIDHAERNVFKGGELMPLKELLAMNATESKTPAAPIKAAANRPLDIDEKQRLYYAAILKAVLYNYPDIVQGLYHHGFRLSRNGSDFYFSDPGSGVCLHAADLLDEKDYNYLAEQFSQLQQQHRPIHVPGITIAGDVDDEAVHGRRRRKKTRANHR